MDHRTKIKELQAEVAMLKARIFALEADRYTQTPAPNKYAPLVWGPFWPHIGPTC